MPEHEKINYVEFPAREIDSVKHFFTKTFNWNFTDYGPDYSAFDNQGLEGGFYKADKESNAANGAALIVFYSEDLELTEKKIIEHGGTISTAIFSFPGGRRFHFLDPNKNEYAVWSDKGL